jgi:hypothetical protein
VLGGASTPEVTGEPIINDEVRTVVSLSVGPLSAREHSEAQRSKTIAAIARFRLRRQDHHQADRPDHRRSARQEARLRWSL